MSNEDRFDAKKDDLKGKAKEGYGKVTDDEEKESEGKMDQVKGDIKEGAADVKDRAKDVLRNLNFVGYLTDAASEEEVSRYLKASSLGNAHVARGEEGLHLGAPEPALPSGGADGGDGSSSLPATERVHADLEDFGGLAGTE